VLTALQAYIFIALQFVIYTYIFYVINILYILGSKSRPTNLFNDCLLRKQGT